MKFFKKFFLSALIFFLFSLFFINNSCSAEVAETSILEIPFSSSDIKLSDSIDREKNVSMQKRWDWADEIQDWIMKIVDVLTKFMWFFAFLFLFYTWISIVIKWDWDELAWAKTKILWTIFALLMTFLIEPLVRTVFFWGSWSQNSWDILNNSSSATNAAKIWVAQIEWFIWYIETFIVLLALVMMMKSAVQMIFTHDEAVKLEEQKKTILWTWVWLVIILLSKILVYFWIYWNPVTEEWRNFGKVVSEISWVINYLLWFLASIAVAMIIYWWTKMIFSWGEDAEEWKIIIKNVVIWSIIISIAYVLVITLIWWKIL